MLIVITCTYVWEQSKVCKTKLLNYCETLMGMVLVISFPVQTGSCIIHVHVYVSLVHMYFCVTHFMCIFIVLLRILCKSDLYMVKERVLFVKF